MERNQPEWICRVGAKMRTERASSINDRLPKVMVVKLQAIDDAERQLRTRETERAPRKR